MLDISDTSTILLSQLFEETWDIFVCLKSKDKLKLSLLFSLLGKISPIGIKNANIANIAKGILFLVSAISSDTLIFISININKNNIDTAPTYTSK